MDLLKALSDCREEARLQEMEKFYLIDLLLDNGHHDLYEKYKTFSKSVRFKENINGKV